METAKREHAKAVKARRAARAAQEASAKAEAAHVAALHKRERALRADTRSGQARAAGLMGAGASVGMF